MNTIKHKTAIPRLRFPEFKDTGDWEEKKLGELCRLIRGPFGGALKKEIFVSTGYAVYEQSHAIHRNFSSFRYYINEDKFKELKRFMVQPNDIIMSCSGTMGKFAIIPKTAKIGVINQALLKLTLLNNNDINFINITLELPENQNKLLSQSAGGAIKNVVEVAQIKAIPLFIPTTPEQQKIAECLTSLDDLISAENEKLDALREHKKGLLQVLFPYLGEKVPKLRFPEFKDAGVWEEQKLGELCKFIRGPFGGALKKEIFVSNGYAVYEQSHAINSDFSKFRYYIDETKFKELKRFTVKPDDIIMSCSGTMGKFAIIPKTAKVGVINQALLKLTLLNNNDINFIKITLELPENQNKLLSQSAGGAIKNVVEVAKIKVIPLIIPKLPEQSKIVKCLSSLDDQLVIQIQKIKNLEIHKKGLMHSLFPIPNLSAI